LCGGKAAKIFVVIVVAVAVIVIVVVRIVRVLGSSGERARQVCVLSLSFCCALSARLSANLLNKLK